ncbi:MAG: GGDEF domain-containing protein [Rhodospirillales bacterium]|nr:GGDEF domain-containing protein [Rhodospirillales bacterium]
MVDSPYQLRRERLQPADAVGGQPRRDPGHDGGEDRRGRGSSRWGEKSPGWSANRSDDDYAGMFDIPNGELTPQVRRALTRLLARFDETRKRLDAGHDRELYLQGLADGDVVLPIGNRRFFIRELSRIIERSRMAQTTSTLVLISLADAAAVRVVHGEAAAQALFCEMAGILVAGIRASDVVASLGGYDFGVILTLTAGDAAEGKACDLVRALAARPVDHATRRLRVEPAWGLHEIGASDTADAAIAAADQDLVARAPRAQRR